MTHAFFKALLFLGSGSVIHAMGGEQDMRKMGDLRRYMPVTYMTMMIGTLAIAGIFPLAGFFSKDEILFRAFLTNKAIWVFGVVTALMTAFSCSGSWATFYGRTPAWNCHHAPAAAIWPMARRQTEAPTTRRAWTWAWHIRTNPPRPTC
jgi:NADH-quinone oxidoreductase subunit L